jgi:hypothetical protein
MTKILFLFAAAIFLLAIVACEQEPAERARSTVLDFVRELRSEGSIELDNYLILSEVVRENAENVYTYNDSLPVSQNIEQFRKLFESNGRVRRLWTEKQIIVGESEVLGDTAYVEVSFIDREERRQFYNKMGLKRTDEGWKIFAFKLL